MSISKLAPLLTSYDPAAPIGSIKDSEWQDELKFNNIPSDKVNLKEIYTNDLIKEINDFDRDKIIQEAKNFKFSFSN